MRPRPGSRRLLGSTKENASIPPTTWRREPMATCTSQTRRMDCRGGNEEKELDFQGVYRLAASGPLTLLTDELSRPNGIAFSPDQSILYVANSDGANQPVVMAYDVESDGGISNGRVFFESWGDGMAVDQEGNVYVTGPRGGVLIINADGEHLGTLLAPPRTSNATFGEDGSTLFVTANTRLVRIRLNVKGVGF